MNWISVKDRLPELSNTPKMLPSSLFSQDVLFLDVYDKISLGYYNYSRNKFLDAYECEILEVTHWMPLPELPKD